jgi:amidase
VSGFKEYEKYDGLGLAELVRRNQVKPIELIEEAISRIEKLNGDRHKGLNAVVHTMYEQARKATAADVPDGAFRGVPFLMKDLDMACAGVPLTNGSRFFRDFVPNHDSELVCRYRKSGVIIVGKTNLPELGLAPVTESELFGPARNPWDMTRTTGGSSGGAAAAVSARIVPLAHASDGGGSIRIPSSCCGVFGLKPTRGRTPAGPDYGELWRGYHVDHVLTRSVRDSAAMLDATAGPDPGPPYFAPPPEEPFLDQVDRDPGKLRIGFTDEFLLETALHPDCRNALDETVKLCQSLGHELVDIRSEVDTIERRHGTEAIARAFITMVFSETRAFLQDMSVFMGKKLDRKDFEVMTWVIYLLGKQFTAAELSRAMNLIQLTGREIGELFTRYDVVLLPTLAKPPIKIGELKMTGWMDTAMGLLGRLRAGGILKQAVNMNFKMLSDMFFSFMPYTPIFNATGQPAMSVPLFWNQAELPIGMQFVGRYADEATLFRLARQLEKAKPWADKRPPNI